MVVVTHGLRDSRGFGIVVQVGSGEGSWPGIVVVVRVGWWWWRSGMVVVVGGWGWYWWSVLVCVWWGHGDLRSWVGWRVHVLLVGHFRLSTALHNNTVYDWTFTTPN